MPTADPRDRRLRLLFFGTYDVRTHPRVQVLIDGCRALGDEVVECNVPLGVGTADRVAALRRPYLVPLLAGRLLRAWAALAWRARRLPGSGPFDAVVVGYLGHFDVHLARLLFDRATLVLDQMVFAADTATDRRLDVGWRPRLLGRIDGAAVSAAAVTIVDTAEQVALVPAELRARAVVVPVGAPEHWFRAPAELPDGPLRVVFFGLYTPLQGAPTIGRALGLLAGRADVSVTMVGSGQELPATRSAAARNAHVTWIDWTAAADLPALVGSHEVCLGIFGTGAKALRVVPNKVYQGAAAGCAVVTSDTAPQRAALGDDALLVPPGDAAALAAALGDLADDRRRVEDLRSRAYARADRDFRPARVVQPLRDAISRSQP
jgi:glycosyltransferase involved in cell wall biosynthesis